MFYFFRSGTFRFAIPFTYFWAMTSETGVLTAGVIIPGGPPQIYSYRIPAEMAGCVDVGSRVFVPFGKIGLQVGVVWQLVSLPEYSGSLKEIVKAPDNTPLIPSIAMQFMVWLSDYYMATPAEVLKAVLPATFRPEKKLNIRATGVKFNQRISVKTEAILDVLESKGSISEAEIVKICGTARTPYYLKKLLEAGVINVDESLPEKSVYQEDTMVSLNRTLQAGDACNALFEALHRSPKQQRLLASFLNLLDEHGLDIKDSIEKDRILAESGVGGSVYSALIKKGVFVEEKLRKAFSQNIMAEPVLAVLTSVQQKAYDELVVCQNRFDSVLLHGVTASGKTELYFYRIADMLSKGRQVLFLLPEIGLTQQFLARISAVFGAGVMVYNSAYTDNQRAKVWDRVANDQSPLLVLGTRSALLLPFTNLGLIVVDEEHDGSYKQSEPAPRYNARDAALVLAAIHKAKVILGSATPSFESWYNCTIQKYGYVYLGEKYFASEPTHIEIVDMAAAYKRKIAKGHFSYRLIECIEVNLEQKHQIILLQNRRGYERYLECAVCGHVEKCRRCNVALTVHQFTGKLVCHYCGFNLAVSYYCSHCHQPLKSKGFGTEMVVEEVQKYFPNAKVARADTDTLTTRKKYSELMVDFAAGKIDILVGTQMITKGLDFENVGLVGVMNADNLLSSADFRAYERGFQMLWQVAGRTGRRGLAGHVVLQTYMPESEAIGMLSRGEWNDFLDGQFAERQFFKYPPYFRLIIVRIESRIADVSATVANELVNLLPVAEGIDIAGPYQPPVNLVKGIYLWQISLKISRNLNIKRYKELLQNSIAQISGSFKAIRIFADVDPY